MASYSKIKSVVIIILAWLLAIAVVYLIIQKFRIFLSASQLKANVLRLNF